jgi:HK97 family phage major capsid protein
MGGQPRLYCSDAHRQAGYRARKVGEGPVQRHYQGTREEVVELLAEIRREYPGPGVSPVSGVDTPQDVEFERAAAPVQAAVTAATYGPAVSSVAMAHWVRTGEIQGKSIVADATGGILLPTDYAVDAATVAREVGLIRQLASVRPTNRIKHRAGLLNAASVGWGKLETGTSITDAGMSVSSPALDIDVHDLQALALIGTDELEDSPEAVRSAIVEAIGVAIAEAEDAAFASGTGSGQPKGLALAANVARIPGAQKVAASVSATPAAADLQTIPGKLPVKYRRGAVWLASTDMYAKILALLFPTTLLATSAGPGIGPLNYPLYEIPGLPSAATAGTTDASVFFVNLALAYRVVDHGPTFTVTRLDERYAGDGQVGLIVRRRCGGDLVRPDAACVYTL